MGKFNNFGCNDRDWFSRYIENRRRFEKYDDKPFGDNFPFSIERKATDSEEYYKGLCQGAKIVYEMWNVGIFEDDAFPVTYFSHDTNRSIEYEDDEDFSFLEEDGYAKGFDAGFEQGYQSACADAKTDIYIDTEKVCKLDQLHNELLELGRRLQPTDIDKLNAVLKRVVELKYDVVKDAVDNYLGYK